MHTCWFVCFFVLGLQLSVSTNAAGSKEWTCNHHTTSRDLVRGVSIHEPTYSHVQDRKRAIVLKTQHLRIFVHYDGSFSSGLPAETQDRIRRMMDNVTTYFEETLRVRPTQRILLDRDCSDGGRYYIFETPPKKRCVTTCAAISMCGEVQVPPEHLKACSQCEGSASTCQTIGSDGAGVNNADFVLYASAVETSHCSSAVAYAGACQMEDRFDRPIAGHVNFCPDMLAQSNAMSDTFMISLIQHEILHTLAFSYSLFPFWRDLFGNPRTPRDSNGDPPRNSSGHYVPSTSTVREVTYNNWQTRTGTVSHTVYQLVTPRVVQIGRQHFNCPSLTGVELENQGDPGSSFSHWEMRILQNEVIVAAISQKTALSRFTLALLEDSGWYGADYSKAEQLVWGKDSGCDLPTGSCGGYIRTRQERETALTPFCNRRYTSAAASGKRYGCTADRTALSECNLRQRAESLPPEYQYFSSGENFDANTPGVELSRLGGAQSFADYCPFQTGFTNGPCDNPSNSRDFNAFAETYGPGSRCVFHGGRWNNNGFFQPRYGAGCYQYNCSNNQVNLFVLGRQFVCASAGELINISMSVGNTRYEGSLVCPSCLEICYDDPTNCDAAAQSYSNFFQATRPNSATSSAPLSIAVFLLLLLLPAAMML